MILPIYDNDETYLGDVWISDQKPETLEEDIELATTELTEDAASPRLGA